MIYAGTKQSVQHHDTSSQQSDNSWHIPQYHVKKSTGFEAHSCEEKHLDAINISLDMHAMHIVYVCCIITPTTQSINNLHIRRKHKQDDIKWT